MKNLKQLIRQTFPTILMLLAFCTPVLAQNGITVKGNVTDNAMEPLIGASVVVKGQTSVGTVTDFDGNFVLKVPSEQTVLVISYVGMTSKEVKIGKQREFKVSLLDDTQLEEVVVVGFGQQKKASVVGAITQTTGEVLERAAGIGSVGAALTGNLPGVATIASTGQPGEEDPRIYIRGAAAWNQDAQPLILVDGVKREIKSVDVTSVATISVLKDASATAVYGVEGANGVILITTKRGQEGKARIDVGFNATLKAVSKLPRKYDSMMAICFVMKLLSMSSLSVVMLLGLTIVHRHSSITSVIRIVLLSRNMMQMVTSSANIVRQSAMPTLTGRMKCSRVQLCLIILTLISLVVHSSLSTSLLSTSRMRVI